MNAPARTNSLLLIVALAVITRDAAGQATGTFGNCDPQIHDKLVGAEWRSPSECEVNFDAYAAKG